MHISWDALGEVFLVSFGTAVGLILLASLGIAALAPPAGGTSSPVRAERSPALRYGVAGLCFLACVLLVGYGIYVIVGK